MQEMKQQHQHQIHMPVEEDTQQNQFSEVLGEID
jgi:hypothetical protein